MTLGLTCNSCNKEFNDDTEQKLHYKSEWHRYNLKRKVAGVPGVTEALFLARQSALAEDKSSSCQTPMLYHCGLCCKEYKSPMAHAQHLKSRSHVTRASRSPNNQDQNSTIIKPLPSRIPTNKPSGGRDMDGEENEESEDEWEEVDSEDMLVGETLKSLKDMDVNSIASKDGLHKKEDECERESDPLSCFMCDLEHDSIESCMIHMHKQHGLVIPDIEYLKDPEGLLTYLGLKVKRDFICLYCNERCHPFNSLEAVRKHMVAKSHCRVHYGDGDDEEEAELEDFYDYNSSFVDSDGKQLSVLDDIDRSVELGTGGFELVITRRIGDRVSTKVLGYREYLRYYRHKPRPSATNGAAATTALAARSRRAPLDVVQQPEGPRLRMKAMRRASQSGEAMRTKIGMKNNVIRNLPKNVPY